MTDTRQDDAPRPKKQAHRTAREARRAAALRKNLQRRKQQARDRTGNSGPKTNG